VGKEQAREKGRNEVSKAEKESIRKEIEKGRRGVTEGTGSGLHHPATKDGEISCSLREYGSHKDSNGWLNAKMLMQLYIKSQATE